MSFFITYFSIPVNQFSMKLTARSCCSIKRINSQLASVEEDALFVFSAAMDKAAIAQSFLGSGCCRFCVKES